MKSYCKNCETIQPSSFRPCTDAVTGASYEDLCCDSCHYIVATIEERKDLVQPAQEREALKLALKVLEDLPGFRADIDNAITVIKEVLEKTHEN